MDYAVITTGGKQYKVSVGDVLEVENLGMDVSKTVDFEKVLLVVSDGGLTIGKPYVDGAIVAAKVLENKKGEKIRVSKFKAKSRYRRVTGHRQLLSKIQIESISPKSKSSKKA